MSAGTPCALAMLWSSPTSSAFCSKKPPSFVDQSGSSSPITLLKETASLNGDGFGVAVAAAAELAAGALDGALVAPPPQAEASMTDAIERARGLRMDHLRAESGGRNGNTIAAMRYTDLRTWIAAARELGEVKDVHGASWQEDIGRVTEMLHHTDDSPAVLFDDIPGYPTGHRILVNANANRRRLALTLGLPLDIDRRPLMDEFLRLSESDRRGAPRFVKDGPVFENVLRGDDIDVLKFPSPKWHPLDGGRYLGTGVCDILKDPDSDWVNIGTYRVQVQDRKHVTVFISPGKHGRQFRDEYFKRKQPCPIAMVIGGEPLLFIASSLEIPYGVSEYDFAGAIRGEPYEVVRGPVTGLPIPANAEIVIEGFLYHDKKAPEGPFGEWTGYYASGE